MIDPLLMSGEEATKYIRDMISTFQMPGTDAVSSCLLAPIGKRPAFDAEIIISSNQAESFYKDIFQFWVRAFFFFNEDLWGKVFQKSSEKISCTPISPEAFGREFREVFSSRDPEEIFLERQSYPQSYTEILKRNFSNSYEIINGPEVRSCVAKSDGEFAAFFVLLDQSQRGY